MYDIIIYTDGSARPNPGPGGWSAILESGPHRRELSGSAIDTTSNAMELTAILEGLCAIKRAGAAVEIHTDSKNAIGWLSLGWKCSKPHLVELRAAIWRIILEKQLVMTYVHVEAHAGDPGNENADMLAAAAALDAQVAEPVLLHDVADWPDGEYDAAWPDNGEPRGAPVQIWRKDKDVENRMD